MHHTLTGRWKNAKCGTVIRRYSCQTLANVAGQCLDIDECLDSPCDGNATCTNFDGGYSCACNEGFEGDGSPGNCTDESVDECAEGKNFSILVFLKFFS